MLFVTGVFDLINLNRSVFAVVLTQFLAAIGGTSVYIYKVKGQPSERRPKLTWVHSRIIPLESVTELKRQPLKKQNDVCWIRHEVYIISESSPEVYSSAANSKYCFSKTFLTGITCAMINRFFGKYPFPNERNLLLPISPNPTLTSKRRWLYLHSKLVRIRDIRRRTMMCANRTR